MPTGVEPLVVDKCNRWQRRIGRLLLRRRDPPWLGDRWKQRHDQNDRLCGDRDRAAALADPTVKAKILKMGMEARSSTPQELDAFDRSELARWGNVVKASGYVPE